MSKIKTASFLGFVAIITGVMNYVTHPILLRYLPEVTYSRVAVIVSIIAIISIPASGFGFAMLEFFRSADRGQFFGKKFLKKIQKYSLYHAIFLAFSLLLLIPILDIPFGFSVFLLFLVMIPNLFVSYYLAFLQSKELFILIGVVSLVASITRFILSGGIIFFPSEFLGILVFLAPAIINIILFFYFGKKFLKKEDLISIAEMDFSLREKIPSFVWYIILSGLLILLQNIDIILVKMIFPTSEAVLYMAVAVLIKFALVIIGIIETISLPTLMESQKNFHFRRYLYGCIAFMILGFLVSIFFLPYIGNFVLNIIKPGMQASYQIWSMLGIAMVSLGFFSIFSKVLVAQKISLYKIFILPVFLFGCFFMISTLEHFVMLFAAINFSLCISSIVFILRKKKGIL